jgi:hypothetical protein
MPHSGRIKIISASVHGEDELGPADWNALRRSLSEVEGLQGSTRMVRAPLPDGALGGLTQALEIVLTDPALIPAVSAVLVTWLRRRGSRIKITIEMPGGSVTVKGANLHGKDGAELARAAADIAGQLANRVTPAGDPQPPEHSLDTAG